MLVGTGKFGVHLMADGYGADPGRLRDRIRLIGLLDTIPTVLGMYPIAPAQVIEVELAETDVAIVRSRTLPRPRSQNGWSDASAARSLQRLGERVRLRLRLELVDCAAGLQVWRWILTCWQLRLESERGPFAAEIAAGRIFPTHAAVSARRSRTS